MFTILHGKSNFIGLYIYIYIKPQLQGLLKVALEDGKITLVCHRIVSVLKDFACF